ncbi:apolipoprotein N-acyltransferase [Tessaracoccus massiliensis]|uniref:apolipoprotein N-acyltransferase n=1 Tax=Tessaracoccus massiliensis TaxID=1522311 RepID=UPI001119937B|nr:apolipoprotein N-acyltransferase [Tessaracoccus massiliensis]
MIYRPQLPVVVSLLVAFGIGLLIGTGQAPMGVWPATMLGVGLFTWFMAHRRPGPAFGYGYLTGLAMNTLTVSWVSVLGVWVGVALVAFLALWWGLLAVVVSRLTRLRFWPLLIPAAWVAMEFASGKIPFGGFSWTRLGYTAIDQPMSGWFAYVGVTGVSYLVALVANAGVFVVTDQRRRLRVLAGALAIFVLGGLLNLTPHADPETRVSIAVVQPNVNRHEHGTASYARSVTNNALSETIFALAEARTGEHPQLDFVLWPENATDVDPIEDPETRRLVEVSAHLAQVPIFVGAVMNGPEPDTRQTSSLWWHPLEGPGDMYHKRDLVPFGEWIPFREVLLPRLPILRQIGRQSIPGEGPGVVHAPIQGNPHLQVGTIICFELAYDDTSYDAVRGGGEIIVSQSNTNTYGGTFQPPQQLVINRVRAMETGREVVVSTLNSLTGIVDTRGRVDELTDEFEAASRIVTVPLRYNTNLAVHLGAWPAWASLLTTLLAFAYSYRRAPQRAGSIERNNRTQGQP